MSCRSLIPVAFDQVAFWQADTMIQAKFKEHLDIAHRIRMSLNSGPVHDELTLYDVERHAT